MSGKPAARQGDATLCPLPGHGNSPIATGSPDVLIDGLPAARMGDTTACGAALNGNVISNLLINGQPAVVLGSLGSHGNVVVGGSSTVIIGNSAAGASSSVSTSSTSDASAGAAATSTPAATQALRTAESRLASSQSESFDQDAALEEAPFEEEEEEEELIAESRQAITLRVGFFFDGTGDNADNVARGNQCRASQLGLDSQDAQNLLDHCLPHQMDPMSSYGRERTNIAKLFDFYMDDSARLLEKHERKAMLRVYIEGVGTEAGQPDKIFPDMALGRGRNGVLEKFEYSITQLSELIDVFAKTNPQCSVSKIEIDIFGFSRGAAASRHFVNDLRRGRSSQLAQTLRGEESLAMDFDWRFGHGVRVNLIGLFDTVAAIGTFSDGWDVHDDRNGDIRLHLAPDSAPTVIHLVAGDEYRHNYSLNSTRPGFKDIVIPGAHGDIGGSYPAVAEEHLFLTRPFIDIVDERLRKEESLAWRRAEQALAEWRQRGLLDPWQPEGRLYIDCWEVLSNLREARPSKAVYAQIKLERRVRGEYGRITLRLMHALARDAGAPFKALEEHDPQNAIPASLTLISDKLLAYARGQSALNLSPEEITLLKAHYLHQSAHWNIYPGESGAMTAHFVNRPAKDNKRAIHANKAEGVFQP